MAASLERSARRDWPTTVLAATFAYLLAGVNLINSLLPTVRTTLGITTGTTAALYALYLMGLVPLLMLLPKVSFGVKPRTRLLVSVAVMPGADVLHAVGNTAALGAGRLLMACSVALGTGAVGELAVLTAGESGRTVTATANTAGALIGTVLGGVGLFLVPSPVAFVFLGHALGGLLLVLVVIWVVPHLGARAVGRGADLDSGHDRRRLEGVMLGGFAFAAGATVIVLAPSLYEQEGGTLGDRVLFVPVALFLSAAVAQTFVARLPRSIHVGGLLTMAGQGLLFWAVLDKAFRLLVTSAAVTGLGYGAVFVVGLAWTTQASNARNQAALASIYSGTAYACAAAVTVGCGYLADVAGAPAALLVGAGVSSASFLTWTIRARSYPWTFGTGMSPEGTDRRRCRTRCG